MDNWDEEKLKEVVEKKHGENDRKMPKTDIVSHILCMHTSCLHSNKNFKL